MYKSLLILLVLGFAFGTLTEKLHAKTVPTPEMAIEFVIKKDPKKWTPKFVDGNERTIVAEFVPEGEAIESWNEMVAVQTVFVGASPRQFVDVWSAGMKRAEPNSKVDEDVLDDGSILVTYTAPAAKEVGIRRFMSAKDGVYMLAYHVRPAAKDENRMDLWRGIIKNASLVPNPERKQ